MRGRKGSCTVALSVDSCSRLLSSLLHISCCGDECEFLLKNGKYKIKTCQQRKEIKNERGKGKEGEREKSR